MAKANNSSSFNAAAKNAAAKAAKNAARGARGESSIDSSSLPKQSQVDFSSIQIPSPDASPYNDVQQEEASAPETISRERSQEPGREKETSSSAQAATTMRSATEQQAQQADEPQTEQPAKAKFDFSGIQMPAPDADPYADLSGLAVGQPKAESPNELQPEQPEQGEPTSTAPTEPAAASPAPQPRASKPEAAEPRQKAQTSRDRADEVDEAEARKAELQVAMAQAPATSAVQFSGKVERDRYRAKSEIRGREDSQHQTARKSRGGGVNGKAGGDSYLLFDEASVGTELIIACLRHPSNKLIPMLQSLQGWEDCDFSYATTDPERWVDDNFDRWNDFPFESDVDKQPVPESPSMHVRTIKLHEGSGVRIHPVMAKMYTADFDGDDISVRFSYNIGGMHRPVSFLVGTAGDVKIDADFFPLSYWGDESVVETLLESTIERGLLNQTGLKKVAKAYVELTLSKKADEDISGFFRILVAEVEKTSRENVNHRALKALKTIYDASIDVMKWQTFTTIDSQSYLAQLERIRGEVEATLPEGFAEVDQSDPGFSAQNLGAAQAAAIDLIGDRGEGKSASFRADANTGKSTRNNPHTVWNGSKWGFAQTTGPSPEWDEQQRLEYSWRESGEEKLALAAAARYSYDEHAYTQSVEMRRMVLSRMAGWGYGGTLPAYLKGAGKFAADLTDYFRAFIVEYNRAAEILNGGRGAWNLDGSDYKIDKSKTPYPPIDLETATMTDMATAYSKVCGEYSFEYLWGDFVRNSEVQKMLQHSSWHGFDARFFTASYADFCELNTMNLEVGFLSSEKNTIEPSEYTNVTGGGYKRNGKPIDSRVGKISWSDPKRDQMFRLLVSSAAIKTKFSHRFTKDFDQAFTDFVAKSRKVAKKGNIREQLPVLFLSLNPDMFLAFGMGNKGAFDSNSLSPLSKVAQILEDKTLRDSEKADKVKSVYLTLVAQYQTRRLATAKANAEKIVKSDPTPEKLFACDDSWRKGLADLASTSQAWSIIAQDLDRGGGLLRSLRSAADAKKDVKWSFGDRSPVLIGKAFSKKLLAANEYNSLLDLLLDEDASYDLKIQAVNLAQRIFGRDVNQPSDSVLPELLRNSTGVHAGNQYLIRRDNAEMRRNLNAFNEAVEGWYCPSERGGMDTLKLFKPGNPEKGYPTPKEARNNVLCLIDFLRDVSDGRRNLISIPKTAYAMAAAQMWFSTPSSISEKNTQQDALYFLYSCNAYSVNGGMYSDQNMATNWAQGACDVNDFINNPMFVVRLLTDPDYSIDVGSGEHGRTVTMQTLLGEGITPVSANYVDAVQAFLIVNPNVAASLMPRTVKPGDKADGHTERLDFDTLLNETLETKTIKRRRDRVANDPDFLALLMLTVKGSGRSYGNLLNEFEQNVDPLIAYCSNIVRDGGTEELRERLAAQIEEAYGYDKSEGSLYDQAMSDDGILGKIIKSIERVGESVEPLLPGAEIAPIQLHLDDEPTLSMYQSMMARATSMQTAHLTSVNGAESVKNAALAFCAAANPEEDCGAAPPEEVDLKVVEDSIRKNDGVYEGRRLHVQREDGSIDSSIACTYEMLDDIRSIAERNNGKVRVESPLGCVSDNPCGCHRHSIWDPSTDKRPWHQSTSLGRFMTVFRTFATETYNLQAKKKIAALTPGTEEELREGGGTARIVKRNLWKDDWFQTKDFKVDMQAAWDKANDLDDVKTCLAKRFQLAATAIGYEQLSYNDWLSMANVLVKPKTEDDNVVGFEVLTITRLAEIGRNALFDYLAVAPKDHSFSDSANAIMDALSGYSPKSDEENLKWFNDSVLPAVRACRKSQREDDGLRVLNRMVTSEERRVEALKKIADRAKVPIGQRNRKKLDRVVSANKAKYKNRDGNFADLVKSHKVINGAAPMVGDVYAYVVDTQERLDKWLPVAKKYGMTLIVDPQAKDVVLKPEDASNAYFLPDGTIFINFLEVEMNGSFSPTSQASIDLGTFEADDDALSQDVHDEFGILKLGDAETRLTDYGYENLEVLDAGVKRLSNEQLFGGAIQAWYDEHPDTFEQAAIILPGQSDDFTKSDLAEILSCAREGRPYRNAPVSWSVGDSNEEYFMNDLAIWADPGFMGSLGEDCVIHDASANTCVTWAVMKMPDGEWVIAPVRIGDVTGESAAMPAHVQIGQVGYDQFDGIKMEYFYHYDYSKEGPIGVKSCQGGMGSNKEWSGDKGIRDKNGNPWETDPVLTDGSHIKKYDADASTRSRLYMFERKEAMNTLMLKARTNRWGYNLGEVRGIFNGNAELQQGLADGTLTYGDWQRALEQSGGFVDFWPKSDPKAQQMNVMLNRMLQRSLNCGLNPTVVFASHVNGKPIRSRWFNCYYVLEPSESFQDSFLHMMATMNPSLCSDGLWDESDDVVLRFYPEALGICRALVPLYYEKSDGTLGTVHKRTRISISFSYFTDDTSSLHRRAAESSLFSPSFTNTLMYDGRYPVGKELHEFEWWALSNMQIAQAPNVTVFNTSGGKPVDDVALSAQRPVSDEIAPTEMTAEELREQAAQVANPQNQAASAQAYRAVKNIMPDYGYTVAFNGSRPKDGKLYGYKNNAHYDRFVNGLAKKLALTARDHGGINVVTGGAQGIDSLAFWAAAKAKKNGAKIKLTLYLPGEGQRPKFGAKDLFGSENYDKMLRLADEVRYYDVSAENYIDALAVRSRAMADDSDTFISIAREQFKNTPGGTKKHYDYAVSKGYNAPFYNFEDIENGRREETAEDHGKTPSKEPASTETAAEKKWSEAKKKRAKREREIRKKAAKELAEDLSEVHGGPADAWMPRAEFIIDDALDRVAGRTAEEISEKNSDSTKKATAEKTAEETTETEGWSIFDELFAESVSPEGMQFIGKTLPFSKHVVTRDDVIAYEKYKEAAKSYDQQPMSLEDMDTWYDWMHDDTNDYESIEYDYESIELMRAEDGEENFGDEDYWEWSEREKEGLPISRTARQLIGAYLPNSDHVATASDAVEYEKYMENMPSWGRRPMSLEDMDAWYIAIYSIKNEGEQLG